VGDGAALCKAYFDEKGIQSTLAGEPLRYQNAWGVAAAAARGEAISGAELTPVYLRLSQAERERNARLQAEQKIN
jgi:tRNA threonylcarbamoyladenosine biosynthesis protein TsaB